MPQHDYVINNQSGAAFRADLNNALAAIVTNNSGDDQPSTTYAYQFWAEEDAGLLQIRDAANAGWVTIGNLAEVNLGLATVASPTFTGAVTIPKGTVGALPFRFTGDTDTGIYSPGTDQVAIATAGVQRVNFNGATEVVFNDDGADVDFRVEGDTKANLFKVDAGTDTVIIDGITQPSADGTNGEALVTDGSGVLSFKGTTCRAWVNFNGTGTVAIRASYNVSSITDNGTGDYTVNFTDALTDTNYAVCGMSRSTSSTGYLIYGNNASGNATGSVRISTSSTSAFADSDTISVAVIR